MSDRFEVMEETDSEGEIIYRVWDNKKMTFIYTEGGRLYGTYSVSGAYFVADTLNGMEK